MTTEAGAPHQRRDRGHGPLGQAQGRPAVHPRPGRVHRRRQPAGPALARHRAQPVRPRDDQGHRRDRGAEDPGRPRGHHRRGPREGRAPLDADPRGRQADGAPDRRPSCTRRRKSPRSSPRPSTSRPTASPRSSSTTSPCPSSSTRTRRWSRAPPCSARTAARTRPTTTSGTGSPATRPRPTPRWPRPRSASPRTSTSRASTSPRSRPAAASPTGMPTRGQLTLHMTSQAPHAIRTVLALVSGLPEQNIRVKTHDIGGGFGGKVPVYPGYVLAVVASPDRRQAGQVDRGPLGEPPGGLVRPRLPHQHRGGRRTRPAGSRR